MGEEAMRNRTSNRTSQNWLRQAPIVIFTPATLPAELWRFIEDDDDIDYIAIVSKDYYRDYGLPVFLDSEVFGCCCRKRYEFNQDYFLWVGYHA